MYPAVVVCTHRFSRTHTTNTIDNGHKFNVFHTTGMKLKLFLIVQQQYDGQGIAMNEHPFLQMWTRMAVLDVREASMATSAASFASCIVSNVLIVVVFWLVS